MSTATAENGGRPVYYDLGHLEFGPEFTKIMTQVKEDMKQAASKSSRKLVVFYGTGGNTITKVGDFFTPDQSWTRGRGMDDSSGLGQVGQDPRD